MEFVLSKATVDDVLERVEAVADEFPDLPVFKVVQKFFSSPREVCCTALVDPWINWLIDLEAACTAYNTLPYPGGWLDQPLWVIEIFNEIRSVKNQFEASRMDEISKSSGKGSSGGSSPISPTSGSRRTHPALKAPPANMTHTPRPRPPK